MEDAFENFSIASQIPFLLPFFIRTLPSAIIKPYWESLLSRLIDLDFLGIENLVALRGDPLKTETYFTPNEDGNHYASDLVEQITAMNKGIYLDNELLNSHPTDFCIGVSGYPEKNMEARSLMSDLHFLKKKIDSGAHYLVTQMFYDNKKFFEFVKLARSKGIDAPIIPGLKPLSTLKQLNMIPYRFHVDIPETLVKEVIKCKDNKAVRMVYWTK